LSEKRKTYIPLPEDSPRAKNGKKKMKKRFTCHVLINMSDAQKDLLKRNADLAGYKRGLSEYVRSLAEIGPVSKTTLVVNLSKTVMRNIRRHAEDAEISIEEYIGILSELPIAKG
jgi:hypothetical protein